MHSRLGAYPFFFFISRFPSDFTFRIVTDIDGLESYLAIVTGCTDFANDRILARLGNLPFFLHNANSLAPDVK